MANKNYKAFIVEERVFILSAFPEFLTDYFGIKLWRTCVKHKGKRTDLVGGCSGR